MKGLHQIKITKSNNNNNMYQLDETQNQEYIDLTERHSFYWKIIQFNSTYKDSLCHSNQASNVKTKNNITEHKQK